MKGCEGDIVEYNCILSIKRIKSEMAYIRQQWELEVARKIMNNGLKHYDQMNVTHFAIQMNTFSY